MRTEIERIMSVESTKCTYLASHVRAHDDGGDVECGTCARDDLQSP